MAGKSVFRFFTVVGLILVLAGLPGSVGAITSLGVPWTDPFDAALQPGWTWLNELPAEWSLSGGQLHITLPRNSSATSLVELRHDNTLLRPAPGGNFAVETHLKYAPNTNVQDAGIMIYQDDFNYLMLGYGYCNSSTFCKSTGKGIIYDDILNRLSSNNYITPLDADTTGVYLRVEKVGDVYTAYYRTDPAANWVTLGAHGPDSGHTFTPTKVGITSFGIFNAGLLPTSPVVDYDYFTVEGYQFIYMPMVSR